MKSDEVEWELTTSAEGKQLVITLVKLEKDKPFWTSLLMGHPEVDVRGLKRDPKGATAARGECARRSCQRAVPPVVELCKCAIGNA